MRYNELLIKVTYLTGLNNLTQTEIGGLIGLDKAAVNKRAKNNSKFSAIEIEKIEKHFNIDLSAVTILNNTLALKNDAEVQDKFKKFGERLTKIQEKTGISDKDFAEILKLFHYEFSAVKSGSFAPDIKILNLIKQHFSVSIDWLLYGD